MLTFVLGGAKSGKSLLAQRIAAGGAQVYYVATAVAEGDAEMVDRIARHRANRPGSWKTIEEPLTLGETVERLASDADTVVVDCLTVWLGNLFWRHKDNPGCIEETVRLNVRRIAAAGNSCRVIAVSNELGCGTVPEAELARVFRDTHGVMNQWMAEAADEVILAIAGLPQYLKRIAES
jgi:adenosylcobinamide kinase / adenosylcobinamide-phosphate guanylyltransferase